MTVIVRDITLYVRLGKGRHRIHGDARISSPNHKPFSEKVNGVDRLVPTVHFAVRLKVPDTIFRRAEQVIAEIEMAEDDAEVSAEVR